MCVLDKLDGDAIQDEQKLESEETKEPTSDFVPKGVKPDEKGFYPAFSGGVIAGGTGPDSARFI